MGVIDKKIKRVLIANRGEIAVRVIRAAKEYGLETVAVFSEADQGALHVRLADRSVCLGGLSSKDNYLNQEKLLAAAIQSGADAIHPGYGFFSENAGFAAAVINSGFCFIGPKAEMISVMGDKAEARRLAVQSDVPVVPGTLPGAGLAEMKEFGLKVGYPLMAKAVAGGSGRGMRLVNTELELEEKVQEAQSEAQAAFGNNQVFLEKYIKAPRHIEVQVFGDGQGGVLHFGERECSLQRRHQKLVEEAPATRFHPLLREKMLGSALRLAASVKYLGAGTMEFLVEGGEDKDSPFYFLEMNTRIQVEHPVTEEAYGIDLVQLQFTVAEGKPFPFKQSELLPTRHALEFRIYAENPAKNFKPTTGKILYLSRPGGPGVREDSWVEAGTKISSFYDSLLAKLIVSGRNRGEALIRARRVLADYAVEGLETTLDFHRWLLSQEDFIQGRVDIHWIERLYSGEVSPGRGLGPNELLLPEGGQ